MIERRLIVERADSAALAPFGAILGTNPDVPPAPIDFYRGHVSLAYPVKFKSNYPVELSLATLTRRPHEVRYMERHFQHTQTFIPLGGKPFVAVMAPPTTSDLPELAAVRAFCFDGSAGFTLHLGTWHEFPFAIFDETNLVVILSSQTGYDLHGKNPETSEALGPDLDKKDIVARTGTIFRFDV